MPLPIPVSAFYCPASFSTPEHPPVSLLLPSENLPGADLGWSHMDWFVPCILHLSLLGLVLACLCSLHGPISTQYVLCVRGLGPQAPQDGGDVHQPGIQGATTEYLCTLPPPAKIYMLKPNPRCDGIWGWTFRS